MPITWGREMRCTRHVKYREMHSPTIDRSVIRSRFWHTQIHLKYFTSYLPFAYNLQSHHSKVKLKFEISFQVFML